MKKAIIWDFDGTLIDSYGLIVESLYKVTSTYSTKYTKDYIYKFAIDNSVRDFIEVFSKEHNVTPNTIHDEYKKLVSLGEKDIKLTPNVKEILTLLHDSNVTNFIYTHKGISTLEVLSNLNIDKYFTEVLTGDMGYKRKPHPQAIDYLIEKYNLDKKNTYYVGDRTLDVECGNNGEINSVYYNEKALTNSKANFNITNLIELKDIVL